MKNKKSKPKIHKIKLSAQDEKLLARYCASNNISKTIAIKRILRLYLQESLEELEPEIENQLGLFDPIQMNIFDK